MVEQLMFRITCTEKSYGTVADVQNNK